MNQTLFNKQNLWAPAFILLGWTLFGIFFGTQNYVRDIYGGRGASLPGYLVSWLICGYSWAALTVPVLRLLRRLSFETLGWSRFLLVHIPAAAGFSLIQLGLYTTIASVLFGTRGRGFWAFYELIVVNEFQTSFLVYFALVLSATVYKKFSRTSTEPKALPDDVSKQNGHVDCYLSRLSIKENGRIALVETDDINWIGSYGNYLFVHTAGRRHIHRETMAAMEKKLDPKVFLRIRRSTIVNARMIKELRSISNGEFEVVLKNGTKLTSTRRYRRNLETILKF